MEDDSHIGLKPFKEERATNRTTRHRPAEVTISLASLKHCIQQWGPTGGSDAHCGPAAVQHLRAEDTGMRLVFQLLEQV